MLQLHSEFRAIIEKLVDGGAGLARREGQVVFIPRSCPGEEVEAAVSSIKRGFARAELRSVLRASPDRTAPPCPVYGDCGGCRLQHLVYPAQVRAKVDILRENLMRIGGIASPNTLAPLLSPEPLAYRTRVQFKLDPGAKPARIGFYAADTNRVVSIDRCLIAFEPINRFLFHLRHHLDSADPDFPNLKQIHLHHAPSTGELQARYFLAGSQPGGIQKLLSIMRNEMPELVSQVIYDCNERRRIRGRDYLIDRFAGFEFRISDRSFSQVNGTLREALIQTVVDFSNLTGSEKVLELHCGIGAFSLPLAAGASRLTGLDDNEAAIADARHNAGLNAVSNAEFRAVSVKTGVQALAGQRRRFDRVVLDPPRAGLGRRLLESLVRLEPERIIYVSCFPATLARDAKILIECGYHPETFQPVDLFPQTHHLETVAAFTRA